MFSRITTKCDDVISKRRLATSRWLQYGVVALCAWALGDFEAGPLGDILIGAIIAVTCVLLFRNSGLKYSLVFLLVYTFILDYQNIFVHRRITGEDMLLLFACNFVQVVFCYYLAHGVDCHLKAREPPRD